MANAYEAHLETLELNLRLSPTHPCAPRAAGGAGERGTRSDKDLAASMRNRQRKTTDDARRWRFGAHRTSASPDQWHRCSVITRTSRAKRCKHFGSCLSAMHITQIPTFSPRQACQRRPPGSCPLPLAPCAWAWQQKIRPSWAVGRFWLPCQRDGRFRSLRRHWRVSLDFLEKRHGSASPWRPGVVDAVAAWSHGAGRRCPSVAAEHSTVS